MPTAAKIFKLHDEPTTLATPRQSASARGYDAAWYRFRAWFASIVPPICGLKLNGKEAEYCCGVSLSSKHMHLDHLVAFDGIADPLRLDENNVAWRCATCHANKTNAKDGGGWINH